MRCLVSSASCIWFSAKGFVSFSSCVGILAQSFFIVSFQRSFEASNQGLGAMEHTGILLFCFCIPCLLNNWISVHIVVALRSFEHCDTSLTSAFPRYGKVSSVCSNRLLCALMLRMIEWWLIITIIITIIIMIEEWLHEEEYRSMQDLLQGD